MFSSGQPLLGSPGQGRLRGGQQLGRRLRALAPRPGPAGRAIAWECVGRDRPRHVSWPGVANHDHPEGAYAFETLVRHDRAYSDLFRSRGHGTADLVRRSQGEMFASTGRQSGAPSIPHGRLSPPQDEWPGRLRRLLVEQASVILRRTIDARPLIHRVRPGFTGHAARDAYLR